MTSQEKNPGQLDKVGLLGIARQFNLLRDKLVAKYKEAPPSIMELGAALYIHMEQSDTTRLQAAQQNIQFSSASASSSSPYYNAPRPPTKENLIRYIKVATAAYGTDEEGLKRNVRLLGCDILNFNPELICYSVQASTYCPAYFLLFEHFTETLILCVRGSQEVADVITDLNAEDEVFLDGRRAHKGIVMAARTLHDKLRFKIAAELTRRKPRGGLVVTGHSLGAGTGSALTLLLRRKSVFRIESAEVADYLVRTNCYAFAPPPILTVPNKGKEHDTEMINDGIYCIINGYDIVPRLSLKSVHRLMHDLATLDYSPTMAGITERTTSSIAGLFVPEGEANAFGKRMSEMARQVDAGKLSRLARGMTEVPRNPQWPVLSNAISAVTQFASLGAEKHANRVRNSEREQVANGCRSSNGHTELDIDEDDDAMVLVGNIFFLEREFTLPRSNEVNEQHQYDLPRSRLVRKNTSFFKDVEVSTWMLYDHYAPNMLAQLKTLTS